MSEEVDDVQTRRAASDGGARRGEVVLWTEFNESRRGEVPVERERLSQS
jgi:hypothetical protein